MPQRSFTHLLLLAILGWMAIQTVLRFGGLTLTVLVVAVDGLLCATIYALRFDRARIVPIYRASPGRAWIDFVCRWSGQQAPAELDVEGVASALQLRTTEDFDWFRRKIKEDVFGHDDAVDAIAEHLKTSVRLRGHAEPRDEEPPLGAFVLAGPDGIGKRWLAAQIGRRVFRGGDVTVIDLEAYADEQGAVRLFGTSGQDGAMLQAVRRFPFQTFVLEHLDAAHPAVIENLKSLLQRGVGAESRLSFRNCIVFLTTSAAPTGGNGTPALEPDRLIECLCQATDRPRALFELASACLSLQMPGDIDKARILIGLMAVECRKYGKKLEYVEPEIVSREVEAFTPSLGFEHSQMRIARWMREPLHLAAQHGLDCLVLTRRMLAQRETAEAAARVVA